VFDSIYRVVYKAQCKNTNKCVALKHILINKEDEGFPPSALSEILILQNLIYENIVQLFGLCRSPRMFN
jgi:serine/threonine protein kinase